MKFENRNSEKIEGQLDYFRQRRPVRMQLADTAYVHRHFSEVSGVCNLSPSHNICEWGAGLGRFSRLLSPQVSQLTAIELSPELGAEFNQTFSGTGNVKLIVNDARQASIQLKEQFDRVVGFFVLHHLDDLTAYLTAARESLKPGGYCVFAEPNPYNPLFPVQITLTPGMSWQHERGIYALTPGNIAKVSKSSGFTDCTIYRYGILPRAAYNLFHKVGIEKIPEYFTPSTLRAFQIICFKTGQ